MVSIQTVAITQEINDFDDFAKLEESLTHDAKGKVLIKALNAGFAKAESLGAKRKALIFTESRRTQEYLLRLLAESQ